MVCKEDVLLWFKDLEGYKRIDVMYELLNMCIPFEVRFLGSCIEEIGKHTYQELRGPTIIANDVDRLSKDPTLHLGLLDEGTRHRTVIYMSVLTARNCACANWFYNKLFRTDRVDSFVSGCIKDENTLSELLLLFTLGLYHPAFTFEQKTYFGKLLEQLISQSDAAKFSTHNYSAPRNVSSLPMEAHSVKTSPMMPVVDQLHIPLPPPGLPPPQAIQPIDFLPPPPMLTRTGFPTTVVGAPEMHPFPPQPISPLVSQAASPPHSRASSPHRTYMRPLSAPGMTMPPPQLLPFNTGEPIPNAPPILMDPSLSQPPTNQQQFNALHEAVSIKNSENDTNHLSDDKIREGPWPLVNQYDPMKQVNGIRINPKPPYLQEQMSNMKLNSENNPPNTYHCSSSASSSSSINQSPTETPSVTPAVTPQGPGRGSETKATPRVNGMPPPAPFDYITPFSTCTVPSYSMAAHNRYFQYRPQHVPTMFPYQNTPEGYQYVISFSSMPQPPIPRNPNCYNCGEMGHTGGDCNGHTVEDITQKPYMLEYDSPTLPDNPDK